MFELAIRFEAESHGVADVLMRLSEGNALVGEVGGRGHGVEVAGLGGGLHAVEAELEGAGEGGENAEHSGDGVGRVEDGLLAFLKVFVVGEWEALDEGGEGDGRAEEASGLAAYEFG